MQLRHCASSIVLCIIGLPLVTQASPSVSASPRPVVIELFTSQGCNSCPPAEALLGEYANDPNVLSLSFHVDYWDYLGWHDPFELPVSVQRQNGYAAALDLSTLFTPQSIIDGRISRLGSDRRSLVSAIHSKRDGVAMVLSKSNDLMTITLPDTGKTDHFDINVIAYESQATTAVKRGENAGHTLKEYNIVRNFLQLGPWDGHAASMKVSLSGLPAGTDRIAVLIQQPHQGAIIGAASISL